MPPGSAIACRRAAMLTPSPKMSSPYADDVADVDADAELDPLLGGQPALRSAMPRCTSTAQRTASTALRTPPACRRRWS